MSKNFRLFHVSNLSVRNFQIFLLMYTGSLIVTPRPASSFGLVASPPSPVQSHLPSSPAPVQLQQWHVWSLLGPSRPRRVAVYPAQPCASVVAVPPARGAGDASPTFVLCRRPDTPCVSPTAPPRRSARPALTATVSVRAWLYGGVSSLFRVRFFRFFFSLRHPMLS